MHVCTKVGWAAIGPTLVAGGRQSSSHIAEASGAGLSCIPVHAGCRLLHVLHTPAFRGFYCWA